MSYAILVRALLALGAALAAAFAVYQHQKAHGQHNFFESLFGAGGPGGGGFGRGGGPGGGGFGRRGGGESSKQESFGGPGPSGGGDCELSQADKLLFADGKAVRRKRRICKVCGEEVTDEEAFVLDCGHGFHQNCLKAHIIAVRALERRSATCPEDGCEQSITPRNENALC